MATEKAAIYCRLSQDDGQTGESASIQTQKTLLTQYYNDHHSLTSASIRGKANTPASPAGYIRTTARSDAHPTPSVGKL